MGNEYKTYFQVGNRIMMFDIRQDKNTTEMRKEFYEPSDKSIVHNITYDNCTVVQDIIIISDQVKISNPDFYFLISETEDTETPYANREASVGMSFYFNDTQYSLVHILTKNNIIDKNIYTISPFNNALFFGKVNENFYSEYTYIGNCSVEKNNVNWGCQLLSVSYEEINSNTSNTTNTTQTKPVNKHIYKNKYLTQFTSKEKLMTVPPDFYEMIKESFFKKYFEQNLCDTYQMSMDPEVLRCKYSIMEELGDFIFVFKEITIRIKGRNLFREGVDDCFFRIRTKLTIENKWVFGMAILGDVISSYDYDTKNITLFSNIFEITETQYHEIELDTLQKIKLCCILAIIAMSIFNIGLLTFFYKYLHKHKYISTSSPVQ